MAKTKYRIELTDDERSMLTRIVCEEKESERTLMRARILLMSEATQPEKVSIKKLAEMLGTTDTTVQTVRTEYAKNGVEAAVYRKRRTCTGYNSKITPEVERQIREIGINHLHPCLFVLFLDRPFVASCMPWERRGPFALLYPYGNQR